MWSFLRSTVRQRFTPFSTSSSHHLSTIVRSNTGVYSTSSSILTPMSCPDTADKELSPTYSTFSTVDESCEDLLFCDTTDKKLAPLFGLPRSRSRSRCNVKGPIWGHSRYKYNKGDVLPKFVDWRTRGAISPVRDQGSLSTGWAFGVIQAVESLYQIITDNMIALSVQELMDCDTSFNCVYEGGSPYMAYKYIVKNGISFDIDYPYTDCQGKCQSRKKIPRIWIRGFEHVPKNDERSLQKAVAHQPICVVATCGKNFEEYMTGIHVVPCTEEEEVTYHCMLIVGYGSTEEEDYWIVKNSWGKDWGEDGYVRILRNTESPAGLLGIASMASYPVIY